jgi:acyl-CoA hydrolase
MPRICPTPAACFDDLPNGTTLWTQSMAGTPTRLLEGLALAMLDREDMRDITLLQLHTENSTVLANPRLQDRLRQRCYFVGASTRDLVAAGDADYVPIFLSEIPKLFRRREQRVDVALVQVSPPDKHGFCTLGISVEATLAACEMADRIIAHVNPRMPRTHGQASLPYASFHAVYEESVELPEHLPAELDPVTIAIGRNVASLVPNGACLQMGIGAIPDAALTFLGGHRDLGIHTEMFSDGVLPLILSGVVNNRLKTKRPGQTVTGFVMGTRKLYDFVDDNPEVAFLDIGYVNDGAVIRKNPRTVAINSAIQVDLSGQVCADSIGTRIYSGVGGQMDFIRGASLSEGGKAIIALPSTAAGGKMSRISTVLSPGAGVVTTRAHAQYIVTEHGIAELRGKSMRERALALLALADPAHREHLAREAREIWGLMLNC